jgi:lipopolysaccharide export system protein LptC
MRLLEKMLALAALGVFAAVSLWLQIQTQEDTALTAVVPERHDPDYYIEHFTSTGMDAQGNPKYILRAERLVHYPDDNTSLLDKPHLTQFEPGKAPTNTYAESGWVSPDGDEVLLTGNVRIIRGKGGTDGGGVVTTNKMRIRLKKGSLKNDS